MGYEKGFFFIIVPFPPIFKGELAVSFREGIVSFVAISSKMIILQACQDVWCSAGSSNNTIQTAMNINHMHVHLPQACPTDPN